MANQLILYLNLKPNFDIFSLYDELGIKLIPVSDFNDQKYLCLTSEYGFYINKGECCLYYLDINRIENSCVNYNERELRFVLAVALGDLLLFLRDNSVINSIYSDGCSYTFSYAEKSLKCSYGMKKLVNNCLEEFAVSLLVPEMILRDVMGNFYNMSLEKEMDIYDLLSDYFGVNYTTIDRKVHNLQKK